MDASSFAAVTDLRDIKNAARGGALIQVNRVRRRAAAFRERRSQRLPAGSSPFGRCNHMEECAGDTAAAAARLFRAALAIERERSPGSDLCGSLMKRVSML